VTTNFLLNCCFVLLVFFSVYVLCVPKLFSHFFVWGYIYCGLADPTRKITSHLCLGQCWSSCVVSPSILSSTPPPPLPTCLLFLFLFFVCFCFYFHYSLTYSLSSMVDSFVCFFFIVPRLLASNLAPKKLYRPYFVHVVYRTIVDSESYASFSLSLKALPRSFARVRWRAIHARGHICSFFLHITTHKSRRETEASIWRRPDVKPFSNIVPIFTISKLNFIVRTRVLNSPLKRFQCLPALSFESVSSAFLDRNTKFCSQNIHTVKLGSVVRVRVCLEALQMQCTQTPDCYDFLLRMLSSISIVHRRPS